MFRNRSVMRCLLWIVAEIILNFIGLDDLADYSEFILERKVPIPEALVIDKSINNELEYFNFILKSFPSLPT